jgi:FkbM family methyltransferase
LDLLNLLYTIQRDESRKNDENIIFLGYCLALAHKSYAQNFQDVWALYENNFKRKGFYVEFGGTDGLTSSNSYMLSKHYGWSGIIAEPNPIWHEKLSLNRDDMGTVISHDCVYTETGKTLDFLAVEAADLSTIQGYGNDDEHSSKRQNSDVIKVNTISLLDLLKTNNAPTDIDYISVDTEGSEYEILKAFFETNKDYNVKAFTVEHNFNVDFRVNLFKIMRDNGYTRRFVEFSRWDDFYVKETV